MTAPRQLVLDLERRAALGRDSFLVSGSNAGAADRVAAWRDWPGRRLALSGPPRSGKTHLAHVWRHDSSAALAAAADLDACAARRLAAAGRVVVEDVDRLDGVPDRSRAEEALFHLHNLLDAEGGWLMVTGRGEPARWPVRLPDLASRLQAMPLVRIDLPDDVLLSSVLVKLFSDRQIRVGPEVLRYLVRRMERSFAEAEAIVAELDRRSLATQRPVTRPMAVEVMSRRGAATERTE